MSEDRLLQRRPKIEASATESADDGHVCPTTPECACASQPAMWPTRPEPASAAVSVASSRPHPPMIGAQVASAPTLRLRRVTTPVTRRKRPCQPNGPARRGGSIAARITGPRPRRHTGTTGPFSRSFHMSFAADLANAAIRWSDAQLSATCPRRHSPNQIIDYQLVTPLASRAYGCGDMAVAGHSRRVIWGSTSNFYENTSDVLRDAHLGTRPGRSAGLARRGSPGAPAVKRRSANDSQAHLSQSSNPSTCLLVDIARRVHDWNRRPYTSQLVFRRQGSAQSLPPCSQTQRAGYFEGRRPHQCEPEHHAVRTSSRAVGARAGDDPGATRGPVSDRDRRSPGDIATRPRSSRRWPSQPARTANPAIRAPGAEARLAVNQPTPCSGHR